MQISSCSKEEWGFTNTLAGGSVRTFPHTAERPVEFWIVLWKFKFIEHKGHSAGRELKVSGRECRPVLWLGKPTCVLGGKKNTEKFRSIQWAIQVNKTAPEGTALQKTQKTGGSALKDPTYPNKLVVVFRKSPSQWLFSGRRWRSSSMGRLLSTCSCVSPSCRQNGAAASEAEI